MYREDLNDIPLNSIRGEKGISFTQYYWECPDCRETFQSTLNAMRSSHKTTTKGCPYCSRNKLLDEGSFAKQHPDLMDEYDPENTIDPYNVFPNDKNSVAWICRDCNYQWNATFALRHAGGGICPVCNRTTLIPDINSFAAVYPDHVKYWAESNERKPNEVFYNSRLWIRFICPACQEEHGAFIEDFVAGNSCPVCKGIRVSPETNSIKALYPDIAKRWSKNNSLSSDMVLPSSSAWTKWTCNTCTGEYAAQVKDVVNGTDKCPYCNGSRALPGKTSLKALYPDIAKLISPNEDRNIDLVLPTAHTPYIWRCPNCNYDYKATVHNMVNGYTCPYCNDRQVKSGFNSFADKHPDLLDEMYELANYLLDRSPYDVLDTSKYKFWWICKNNPKHKYYMSPSTRLMFQKRSRQPCLYCRGLRRKLNHFVYFDKNIKIKP